MTRRCFLADVGSDIYPKLENRVLSCRLMSFEEIRREVDEDLLKRCLEPPPKQMPGLAYWINR